MVIRAGASNVYCDSPENNVYVLSSSIRVAYHSTPILALGTTEIADLRCTKVEMLHQYVVMGRIPAATDIGGSPCPFGLPNPVTLTADPVYILFHYPLCTISGTSPKMQLSSGL